MKRTIVFLLFCFIKIIFSENIDKINDVDDNSRKSKSDEILWDLMDSCINSEVQSVTTCLKLKVLHYFDYDVSRISSPRSLSQNDAEKVDRLVVKRFQRYIKSHEFRVQLPEFLFQGATLIFNPKKGITNFDVDFPNPPENQDRSMSAARDMMQQKALLPLLMMLKMKMKMMTPMMLTLVSMKATKAMVISKLALIIVILFTASQLIKKLGMQLPMLHPPVEAIPLSLPITTPAAYGPPPPPHSAYGAPSPPSSSYGSPASSYGSPASSYGSPASSYGSPASSYSSSASSYGSSVQSSNYAEPSSWEPSSSSSNTYSKVWDPQQLAYSAYYKPSSSSSSSSSTSSS